MGTRAAAFSSPDRAEGNVGAHKLGGNLLKDISRSLLSREIRSSSSSRPFWREYASLKSPCSRSATRDRRPQ
ncbi:hypothetical protein EYF80_029028 [Liparis tanakae]|uniref:Uncharacterized protein n=1 Tax=Liparis tanakae TaxID=230148 RepID=A0A4Z2H783_9TELE|nr:hypothetical protein EYF80_029028 [Liparis tanakae]